MCYITLPWKEESRIVQWKMAADFSGLPRYELHWTRVPSSSRRDGPSHRALGLLSAGIILSTQLISGSKACLRLPWTAVPQMQTVFPDFIRLLSSSHGPIKMGEKEEAWSLSSGAHSLVFPVLTILPSLPGMVTAPGLCPSHYCLSTKFPCFVLLGYVPVLTLCKST